MGTGLQASNCSLATLIHLLTWCKTMLQLEASFCRAKAMLLPANAKGERPTRPPSEGSPNIRSRKKCNNYTTLEVVVLAISKHASLAIIKSNKGWMKTANTEHSIMGSLRSTLAGDPALPTSAVSECRTSLAYK